MKQEHVTRVDMLLYFYLELAMFHIETVSFLYFIVSFYGLLYL